MMSVALLLAGFGAIEGCCYDELFAREERGWWMARRKIEREAVVLLAVVMKGVLDSFKDWEDRCGKDGRLGKRDRKLLHRGSPPAVEEHCKGCCCCCCCCCCCTQAILRMFRASPPTVLSLPDFFQLRKRQIASLHIQQLDCLLHRRLTTSYATRSNPSR